MERPHILVIAGTDPSGGAGFQADLQTIFKFGCRAFSAITAVTAQNDRQFFASFALPLQQVKAQLESVDPKKIRAVKTGMPGNSETIREIGRFLDRHRFANVIVDPVLKSSAGGTFLGKKAMTDLKTSIFPRATLITPNLEEAGVLFNHRPANVPEMRRVAREAAAECGTAVLLKGGHLEGDPVDVLADGDKLTIFRDARIRVEGRGTGCRLATGIACGLAKGMSLCDAIRASRSAVREYLIECKGSLT